MFTTLPTKATQPGPGTKFPMSVSLYSALGCHWGCNDASTSFQVDPSPLTNVFVFMVVFAAIESFGLKNDWIEGKTEAMERSMDFGGINSINQLKKEG